MMWPNFYHLGLKGSVLCKHNMQTNVKNPCHIQFDAGMVCANNVIFAFVDVSFFFCGRMGFWWGP